MGGKKLAFVRLGNQVVFPKYAAHENLVLWYDFMGRTNSDTKRTIAEDLSGNGNHGELLNFAFEEGGGYQDDGLRFDGVDDHIKADKKDSFINLNSITIECVIKLDNIGVVQRIVDRSYNNYSLVVWNTRKVRLEVGGGGTNIYSNLELEVGTKYQITAIYDNDEGKASLFINGIEDANYNIVRDINISNAALSFGTGGSIQFLDGNIYSTRIYNRALTPEEIQTNYQIDKQRLNIIE